MIGRIAIIGGGPAGLTAAYELQKVGAKVVVYEAAGSVGGRTRTDVVDDYGIDTGAQLFGSMYSKWFALVEELGLGDRLLRSPGRDALWKEGKAHEITYGSAASMLAASAIPFRTKMKLGTTYLPFLHRMGTALDLHAPERAVAVGLDDESIAQWGEREMGSDFVDYLVYPQLTGYYGALPEETGAALYHILARYGVDVAVYALRGGAAEFAEVLSRRIADAGGSVRIGTSVTGIERSGTEVKVTTDASAESFDAVVLATPAPESRRLIGAMSTAMAEWLDGVRCRPAVTVALLLDRSVCVRYFGLSFPRAESTTVTAICVQENKPAGLIPDGRGALVIFVRPDVAPTLLGAEPRSVVDAVLPDVVRAFPDIEPSIVRAKVYRWPDGNPLMYPGYLRRLATFRSGAIEGEGPVVLAGDYLYFPSVEGAVTSGAEAARRLIARLA